MLHLLVAVGSAATLTVGGGGYSSLQEAIDAAGDGDTVSVGPGTWSGGGDLGGKDLEILSSDGAAATTIELSSTGFSWDQGEVGRLEGFSIQANGNRAFLLVDSDIELVDIEVIGAGDGSDRGGAVSVSGGSVLFERVSFEDSSGSRGGTLYATDGAYVQLMDVTISGSAAGFGGAIYADGVSLDSSGLSIEQVEVDSTGGGFYLVDAELDATDLTISEVSGAGGFGAGLYAGERSGVSIVGGSFTDCVISELDNDYAGGAVYVDGDTQIALEGVDFSGNLSTDGGGLAASGASVELTDVSFSGGEGTRRGGAIYLADSAEVTCDVCDFEGNISVDGGAVFLGTNTIFVEETGGRWLDNMATGAGGALQVNGAYKLELSSALFESNESSDQGGALYLVDLYRPALLEGVELASNRSTNDDGGAIAASGSTEIDVSASLFKLNDSLTGSGGALWFSPDSGYDLIVDGCTFQGNTADREGGAIWSEGGGRLVIHDSELLRNQAGERGGAVAVADSDEVEILRTLLYENTAVESGGGWYERATGTSTFAYNRVVENQAADGGGLYLEEPPHPEVVNNTFAGNTASDSGGHIYLTGGTARLINNIFHQAVDGGGVYGDALAADGSDLFYNDAFENAGGDYLGALVDPAGESGNLTEDPELRAYSIDGDETDDDLHLLLTSACVDAGHPDLLDVDGTRSDMGAYGGIDAAVYDDDGDGAWTNTDCDDSDPGVYPGAAEVAYDGIDQDCDGEDWVDVDGDGVIGAGAGGSDCDDEDPEIYPGATEIWYDGVDSDCDGHSDYDADFDGHDHTSFGGGDCDDADPAINPDAVENWYDGVDQDCDGRSDFDQDGDGYDSDGYGGSDCNDTSALSYPGAPEIAYDGFDQSCDGEDVTDLDGDGYDALQVGGIDCNDSDPTVYPGAPDDPYDGFDQDCDGRSEYDQDGDGFDSASFGGTDCDDTDPLVHPLAFEIWYDGVDSDCDAWSDYDADRDSYESDRFGGNDCDDTDPVVHPDTWEVWYDGVDQDCAGDDDYDQDKDGFQVSQDCDDTRQDIFPGAAEVENGLDDDCDGWAEDEDRDGDGLADWDEWALGTDYQDPDSDGDGREDGQEIGWVNAPADSDLDGVIDPLDADDDGDEIPTRSEDLVDIDGDQQPDVDVDGDGIDNALDSDSDGDGYTDLSEGEADRDRDGVPDYVDYTGDYAGGGCTGGPGGAALLLLLPVLSRRRRLAGILIALIGLGGLVSGMAHADGLDAHGLQVLGATGDVMGYTRLAYPEAGAFGDLDAGLIVDHAADPLVEVLPTGREAVISQLSTANLLVSGSLGSFTRLELVMPVHAVGVASDGLFSAPGDLRLGGVIPAWRPRGLIPGLALAPSVWLPTGSAADRVGNPGISGGAVLAMAQEIGHFGWAVNAGARVGRQEPDRNVSAGAGPLAGLGGHYRVSDALSLTAELAIQGESGWSSFPLEAGGGARLRMARGVWTTLGGAAGLNDAVGSARWRALVGLGWSHRAPELEVFVVADETEPNGDRDGDGFSDLEDDCPDRAETVDGFTDDDGCPELDGDQDGVPFGRDLCPREPIYPEQDPRYSDGCPKLAELSGDKIIITESIFFEEGRASILPVSFEVLRAVSAIVQSHPELDGVLVEGHTNDHGGAELNYQLSEDRAAAVVDWLLADGVDRNRLLSKGYGYDVPLVDHDAPDADRINRRVEFTVVELEDVPSSERMPDPSQLPPP